jgi:hypothetical protein
MLMLLITIVLVLVLRVRTPLVEVLFGVIGVVARVRCKRTLVVIVVMIVVDRDGHGLRVPLRLVPP